MNIDSNLVKKIRTSLNKEAFVPPAPPPMDPAAAGGMPPMDPMAAMAGGAPPMDPAAMAGGAPPMDPMAAGGMPPIDPAMLAAAMDPAAMAGGAPPMPEEGMPAEDPMAMEGGMPVMLSMDDLKSILSEASGGGEGAGFDKRLGAIEKMLGMLVQNSGLSVPAEEETMPIEEEPMGGPMEGAEEPVAEEPPQDDGFTEEVNKVAEESVSNRERWHRDLEAKRTPVLKILRAYQGSK